MKKVYTTFLAVLLTASLFAQAPQKMSYQAVIRDGNSILVTSHSVGMRVSILLGATPVYVETHATNTNANGLIAIEIGSGTFVSGVSISAIDWSAGTYSIKTETDPTGGTNYTAIVGTSQLLSVPYALFAKRAGEHYVGELYGGGVVFWIDNTGHGLICSMIDLSSGIVWTPTAFQSNTVPNGALSDWNGQSNTTAIVSQAGAGSTYAAGLCDAYTNVEYGTGVYSDWYLPSRGELNDLWNNFKAVQKALDSDGNAATTAITQNYYWSSSEINDWYAWSNYFGAYSSGNSYGKDTPHCVRAIRAF